MWKLFNTERSNRHLEIRSIRNEKTFKQISLHFEKFNLNVEFSWSVIENLYHEKQHRHDFRSCQKVFWFSRICTMSNCEQFLEWDANSRKMKSENVNLVSRVVPLRGAICTSLPLKTEQSSVRTDGVLVLIRPMVYPPPTHTPLCVTLLPLPVKMLSPMDITPLTSYPLQMLPLLWLVATWLWNPLHGCYPPHRTCFPPQMSPHISLEPPMNNTPLWLAPLLLLFSLRKTFGDESFCVWHSTTLLRTKNTQNDSDWPWELRNGNKYRIGDDWESGFLRRKQYITSTVFLCSDSLFGLTKRFLHEKKTGD